VWTRTPTTRGDDQNAPPESMRGTVAAHATGNVPVAHIGQSVDDVLAALRGHTFDMAALVPVCTNELLLGVVTVERLLGAAPGASVEEVMDTHRPR
jgi:magnesium transporter